MPRVLCLGHACYDVFFPLDQYPRENSKYAVEKTMESSGGPACNAASLLGLWGARCSMAGLVGQDLYGRKIRQELQEAGVDTSMLELRAGHPSPLSFIIVNQTSGSRTIINRRSSKAGLAYSSKSFREAWPEDPPDFLLFDGHEAGASLAAMEAFPGAVSILDAGSLRRGTEILSGRVDYCIASEKFARELLGLAPEDDPLNAEEALEEIYRRGAPYGAITLGERGCIFGDPRDRSRFTRIPALPVPAVDSTAAGDIFHGAFVFFLMKGEDFTEALILSNVAAGLSVQKPGGRASIPSLKEVRLARRRYRELLKPY